MMKLINFKENINEPEVNLKNKGLSSIVIVIDIILQLVSMFLSFIPFLKRCLSLLAFLNVF